MRHLDGDSRTALQTVGIGGPGHRRGSGATGDRPGIRRGVLRIVRHLLLAGHVPDLYVAQAVTRGQLLAMGDQAIPSTKRGIAIVASGCPVVASSSVTSPSRPPAAIVAPSGDHAASSTALVCPL